MLFVYKIQIHVHSEKLNKFTDYSFSQIKTQLEFQIARFSNEYKCDFEMTQPSLTCSKLTIETLEQGARSTELASFRCLYC